MVVSRAGRVLRRAGELWDSGALTALSREFLARNGQLKPAPSELPSIHVRQGERAVADLRQQPVLLSSSEATTCVIACALDIPAQLAAIAHFDLPRSNVTAVAASCQVTRPPLVSSNLPLSILAISLASV